jgi:hypothetical protein
MLSGWIGERTQASWRQARTQQKFRIVVSITGDAKAKVIVARGERTRCDDEGLALL